MKDRLNARQAIDRIMDICQQLDPTVVWSAQDEYFASERSGSSPSDTGSFTLRIGYGPREESGAK